jgi:hypothetical protein
MNLPLNPILQRLAHGAAAAGPYQGGLPGPPPQGVESFPLAFLAQALKNHGQAPQGVAPHFGVPTPPAGVLPAPEGSSDPAEFYRQEGQGGYAARLWESHHPYAMDHGHEPAWVEGEFAHEAQNGLHNGSYAPLGPGGSQHNGRVDPPGGPVQVPVGSRGGKYTEPLRRMRRHHGLAQALQGGGDGAARPYQAS